LCLNPRLTRDTGHMYTVHGSYVHGSRVICTRLRVCVLMCVRAL
jgi:hypothetical protein